MLNNGLDSSKFEKEWKLLGKQICQAIYAHPKIQKLKKSLKQKGYLLPEEMSEFIDISDRLKYDFIYKRYGPQESDGFKHFTQIWRQWFQDKGVISQKNSKQVNSVDHIVYGSTPDPVRFLLNFEEEVLGSKRKA